MPEEGLEPSRDCSHRILSSLSWVSVGHNREHARATSPPKNPEERTDSLLRPTNRMCRPDRHGVQWLATFLLRFGSHHTPMHKRPEPADGIVLCR